MPYVGNGASGEYSAASAYEAQFLGYYPRFRASTIWQAHTEPKCRFFAWLAIQGKAPTADNLIKKNWPCELNCSLCSEHLLTECNFAEAVWDCIAPALQVHQAIIPFQKGTISQWLGAITVTGSKQQQRYNAGVILFFWWHLWKERNRRIFE